MLRKLFFFLFFGAIIAGLAYGYLYYAVVAYYQPDTPKITHMFLVRKPERSFNFFFNHFDQSMTEKELAKFRRQRKTIPWHLEYDYVVRHSVYNLTMDNR